ncbi:GYD domain-containing protein [Azospirillum sp. TSO22-1]|uniref:GYD domain-containing protein n=1 Tax=Azospirillum sp. TSO22-1 TaxID=716789 RepID=UPI000D64F570|nr:GYD domain-containing protein [Azospirillum sp. TSO22-1]
MPHYMVQWQFSTDNFRNLVQNPDSRIDTVRKGIESFEGKLHHYFFAFGEHDGVVLCEFPDHERCVGFLAMVAAKGGATNFKTTVLLTPEEGRRAFERAGQTQTTYRPAVS